MEKMELYRHLLTMQLTNLFFIPQTLTLLSI
jgi:hypothetical protein